MASQKTNDRKPLESFTLQWRAAGNGGGGSFKRQAELEKAFTEKARQCVPAPRALATRKNRGTATRPAFCISCHLACVNYSFILLSPLSFSLSFFLHLTITFFIYAMVFCLIGLGSFFVRSFMSLFLYASIRWFFLASCISFARFLFVIICLSVLNYFFLSCLYSLAISFWDSFFLPLLLSFLLASLVRSFFPPKNRKKDLGPP